MKKAYSRVCGAVLLTAAITSVWAGAPTVAPVPPTVPPAVPARGAETAPAATMPLDPYAQNLLNGLNSTDSAKREAAQKQLASIAALMQTPELVTRLQDITTDQELKDFFAERITQIKAKEEEKRLTSLPPISLTVSNATLTEVAAALNKALDAPLKFDAGNTGAVRMGGARGGFGGAVAADGGPTWTLDMKDKSLWEIFVALQEQQPIDIQNFNNQSIRLSAGGTRGQRYYAISGPVLTFATGINYQRNINYPTPPGRAQSAYMNVQMTAVIDPRIRATRILMPTAVKAVDDEGRNLANPNSGNNYNTGQTNIFGLSVAMNPPERLAKTVTLSYDSAITTTVGDTVVTIADIQKNANKPVTFAGRRASITNLSGDTQINGTLSVQPISDTSSAGYNSNIPFTISDATGRTLYSSSISMGSTGIYFNTQNSQPPYKMDFRVPGRNVDVPTHVELKDLPMP